LQVFAAEKGIVTLSVSYVGLCRVLKRVALGAAYSTEELEHHEICFIALVVAI
jgi:hypothetical protein